MTNSLVDLSGFPRSDLDVYTVRHTRAQLIRLSNDHKSVLREIELGLHQLHAQAQLQNVSPGVATSAQLMPFARMDGVAPQSPASEAGFERGDLILAFGSLNGSISTNAFSQLSSLVAQSENVTLLKPIYDIETTGSHGSTWTRDAFVDLDSQSMVRKRSFGMSFDASLRLFF